MNTPEKQTAGAGAVKRIKRATGIECANCSTCLHLGTDGDGPEYNGNWPICSKTERYSYLRSFPFKKEMKCWEPNFWYSKFANGIKTGSDAEMERLSNRFREALDAAVAPPP